MALAKVWAFGWQTSGVRALATKFGKVPCVYASCIGCQHLDGAKCKTSNRFLLMRKNNVFDFFRQSMINSFEFVVSEKSKGEFCAAEKTDKYSKQLKASLRTEAAKSGAVQSAARLQYFDQKIATAAIPTERQISRTRSEISGKTALTLLENHPLNCHKCSML